jgi:hypothetical protein
MMMMMMMMTMTVDNRTNLIEVHVESAHYIYYIRFYNGMMKALILTILG